MKTAINDHERAADLAFLHGFGGDTNALGPAHVAALARVANRRKATIKRRAVNAMLIVFTLSIVVLGSVLAFSGDDTSRLGGVYVITFAALFGTIILIERTRN